MRDYITARERLRNPVSYVWLENLIGFLCFILLAGYLIFELIK